MPPTCHGNVAHATAHFVVRLGGFSLGHLGVLVGLNLLALLRVLVRLNPKRSSGHSADRPKHGHGARHAARQAMACSPQRRRKFSIRSIMSHKQAIHVKETWRPTSKQLCPASNARIRRKPAMACAMAPARRPCVVCGQPLWKFSIRWIISRKKSMSKRHGVPQASNCVPQAMQGYAASLPWHVPWHQPGARALKS